MCSTVLEAVRSVFQMFEKSCDRVLPTVKNLSLESRGAEGE